MSTTTEPPEPQDDQQAVLGFIVWHYPKDLKWFNDCHVHPLAGSHGETYLMAVRATIDLHTQHKLQIPTLQALPPHERRLALLYSGTIMENGTIKSFCMAAPLETTAQPATEAQIILRVVKRLIEIIS